MNQNNATNKIATQVSEREIVITRVFDAPRDLVFDAWTKEEHLSKWWGPRGFTTTFQKFDMKPGGTWQFIMHGPDGFDYPNTNVFVEVVKPERSFLPHIPVKLRNVIRKALSISPQDRYETLLDMINDISLIDENLD
ncbi:SRPBCC domain-containing protein [Bacillus sp. V2I10]|uniref:SRPBCC domain-containing protein n=1 Tax=Bacillus sp. V2I10 TaxID=3042276 RepID=UPI00277E15A5|nr:SRPBCC domain-containing protein [Bacillus sp. V2I10]MDQ0859854.1 hypothetical protein [Bacillus sp. V2I10]